MVKSRRNRRISRRAMRRRQGIPSGKLSSFTKDIGNALELFSELPQRRFVDIRGAYPDILRCTLVYTQLATFTGTTGSVVTQSWRGNSVFDPDQTGTGGQPLAFDQWSSFYASYRVHSSSCEITGVNTSGTGTQPVVAALVPTQGAIFATENPYSMAMFPYCSFTEYTGNQGAPMRLAGRMTTDKIFGNPQGTWRVRSIEGADVGTNPTEQWFWTFRMQAADQASTATMEVQTRLQYDVEFYARKQLSLSVNVGKPMVLPNTSRVDIVHSQGGKPEEEEYEDVKEIFSPRKLSAPLPVSLKSGVTKPRLNTAQTQ